MSQRLPSHPCPLRTHLPLLLALIALAVASPARADLIKKEPYLIYPGNPEQMQVVWQLSATDTTRIEWGPDTSCSEGSVQTSEYGTDHQHTWTIGGLAPATKYWFRVTTEGVPHRGSFLSAPAASATQFKFLAYGDTRSYPATHNTVAGAMLAAIAAEPDLQTFTLFMGDACLNGATEASWTSETFGPAYTNIRALMASVAYQATMGNHETYGGTTSLFPKYFPYPFAGGRYYSFDYGPAHFTVIDQYAPYTTGSAQYQWIVNDLAATTKLWKFVLLHEPGWSANGGHLNNTTVQTVLQPLFVQYGVSIVFGGHNHYYSRAVTAGIQHLTLGGGGAPLEVPDPFFPNVVACSRDYHYARIAIDGPVLTFRAIRTTGAVIDSFTLRKDVAPPVIALTSPVGGETWKAGSVHPVTWTATDDAGIAGVDLRYSTDDGASFPGVIATGLANTGSFAWTVPNTPAGTARVRATARDSVSHAAADSSAAPFTIDRWTITASAGTGGSILPAGVVPVVEGTSPDFSIRPDPGWLVGAVAVDGASVAPDTTYTFVAVAANHTIAAAFSDASAPAVLVTSPVGGESWDGGSRHAITWVASDNAGVDSVNVDCSLAGAAGPWQPVAHGIADSRCRGPCPSRPPTARWCASPRTTTS